MKDWMLLADQALEEGDLAKLNFYLGMARDMLRLEHEVEVKAMLRRRQRRSGKWLGHPPL